MAVHSGENRGLTNISGWDNWIRISVRNGEASQCSRNYHLKLMGKPHNYKLWPHLTMSVCAFVFVPQLKTNTDLKNVNRGKTACAKCQHVFFKGSCLCCNWLFKKYYIYFISIIFPFENKIKLNIWWEFCKRPGRMNMQLSLWQCSVKHTDKRVTQREEKQVKRRLIKCLSCHTKY